MVQHETQDSWHAWILGISRCTSLFETCVFLSLVHCGRVHAKNDEDLFIAIWCRTNSGRLRQCGQLGSVFLVRVAIIGSQGWIPSRATSGCGDDFFLHHCVSDFHCDMASLLIYLLQVDWKFHDKDSNISCWPVHQYFDSHQKHCFRFSMISLSFWLCPAATSLKPSHSASICHGPALKQSSLQRLVACQVVVSPQVPDVSGKPGDWFEVLGFTGGWVGWVDHVDALCCRDSEGCHHRW